MKGPCLRMKYFCPPNFLNFRVPCCPASLLSLLFLSFFLFFLPKLPRPSCSSRGGPVIFNKFKLISYYFPPLLPLIIIFWMVEKIWVTRKLLLVIFGFRAQLLLLCLICFLQIFFPRRISLFASNVLLRIFIRRWAIIDLKKGQTLGFIIFAGTYCLRTVFFVSFNSLWLIVLLPVPIRHVFLTI